MPQTAQTVRPEPVRTDQPQPRGTNPIYRHSIVVRITHWINALCIAVLFMSGLQIFNAHPALYWGARSDWDNPVLAMRAKAVGPDQAIGVTTILGHDFDTTGVLGLSAGPDGTPTARGFPAWVTLPSYQWLAMGRRWHFFFAWVFVVNAAIYAVYSLLSGHFWRGVIPSWRELGHIGRSVWDHMRLRFPKGKEARRYNVLQKLSYMFVLFGLGPLIVLAGLAMSPRLDAGYPALLALFGGRQTARTIHFICAFTLVAFALVHILMVLLSGPINGLRSMITGRYNIGVSRHGH